MNDIIGDSSHWVQSSTLDNTVASVVFFRALTRRVREWTCTWWIEVNEDMFLMDYLESIYLYNPSQQFIVGIFSSCIKQHFMKSTCDNPNASQEKLKTAKLEGE